MHTALLIFLSFLPVQSTSGHSYVGSPAVAGIEAADPEIVVLVEPDPRIGQRDDAPENAEHEPITKLGIEFTQFGRKRLTRFVLLGLD